MGEIVKMKLLWFGNLLFTTLSINVIAKEDEMVIVRCLAENFQDEKQIQDCRNFFKSVVDYLSPTGLIQAKNCAEKFWPRSFKVCSTEVARLTAGDEVQECLQEASGNDIMDRLVSGSVCVLESHKLALKYIRNVTSEGKRRGRGGWGLSTKRRDSSMDKKMMMKLHGMAHCDVATEEKEEKNKLCKTCFSNAVQSRSRQELWKALKNCNLKFLSPMYDKCIAMEVGANSDIKAVLACYDRILVGALVKDCAAEEKITTATTESLLKVVECGEDSIVDWVAKHAEPNTAEKMLFMMDL